MQDRNPAMMTKSEPTTDTAKLSREARDKGRSLIGTTVDFNHYTFDAVRQKSIFSGKVLSGTVRGWDDAVQVLLVSVDGYPLPINVGLDQLVVVDVDGEPHNPKEF